METLKYKVITSDKQYDEYCKVLHDLDFAPGRKTKSTLEEIALLTLLIETYDDQQRDFPLLDPVELLSALMAEHNLKAVDLATELGVTKGYVSGILNYKKGLSKEVIRKLAKRFRMQQEAFNRPYALAQPKKKKKAM
jgi:HTH-type transcriptional regulator/antitoxin HigA